MCPTSARAVVPDDAVLSMPCRHADHTVTWNMCAAAGGAELMQKQYIPAPKPVLPGHGESYNPPDEYLPTDEERKEWEVALPQHAAPWCTPLLTPAPEQYAPVKGVGGPSELIPTPRGHIDATEIA